MYFWNQAPYERPELDNHGDVYDPAIAFWGMPVPRQWPTPFMYGRYAACCYVWGGHKWKVQQVSFLISSKSTPFRGCAGCALWKYHYQCQCHPSLTTRKQVAGWGVWVSGVLQGGARVQYCEIQCVMKCQHSVGKLVSSCALFKIVMPRQCLE